MSASMIIKSSSLVPFHPERKKRIVICTVWTGLTLPLAAARSAVVEFEVWKPWPHHYGGSDMTPMTPRWAYGNWTPYGSGDVLFFLFLLSEAKRCKRFIEFAWIPAAFAWLFSGYGELIATFAAWLLKTGHTGHWSRNADFGSRVSFGFFRIPEPLQ